jgi:hypothetical protein
MNRILKAYIVRSADLRPYGVLCGPRLPVFRTNAIPALRRGRIPRERFA